ncbi:MAG TPA: uroporphyrinogen-III synthase [Candidatus Contendobacter sp.]|nr:uroporphyrinogen-III synthase [Candidatus Contendobacter sp.]HRD50326.1 uroporphyrinogen-III synthase [Candidatus Contendobacter sp.]
MPPSLNGLTVLVTRPEHQANPLCQLIAQHGGHAIRCPALVIREPQDWTPARAILDQLDRYDLAIFTSANAVDWAMPLIQQRGDIPPRLEIAAIGKATAQALTRHGVTPRLQPVQSFTSETLLALLRFQHVAGQSVVIVRGEGGRGLLAETLSARGAHVDHAEVYRRERPTADITALLERWRRGEIGAVTVASGETLLNLFDMLGAAGQDYLRETPLIVVSARIQHIAAAQGCRRILITQEASDDAILTALLHLTTPSSSSVRYTI